MQRQKTIIPIEALFQAPSVSEHEGSVDPRDSLADADVILAVDRTSEREILVFGKQALEEICKRDKPTHRFVLRVMLDANSAEVENLLALVKQVRGRHDYPKQP